MKISVRQKLVFFSFVILLCNGFIGYTLYKYNQKLNNSELWVQHTQDVISQSGDILPLAKDMEAASRGFVITNDSTFLTPMWAAGKIAPASIVRLRNLVQDNPVQVQRVDSLSFYMSKRLAHSLQAVDLRSKQGLAAATAYVATRQGKGYTEHIRQLTSAIGAEEAMLLVQRKQTKEQDVTVFNGILITMFILMVVFTILLLLATGNNFIQGEEKERKAAELVIANKELQFQNEEKERRAAELTIANRELVFQNKEKEKRAAELMVANKELAFQSEERVNRATEVIIANEELIFQNGEKEKRADELIIANKELAFQNEEKGNRASELIIANKELAFQNDEKEKRAAELAIAITELAFQNDEKEKRAAELISANKELMAFNYVASHDLVEPLRKIQVFSTIILEKEQKNLSVTGKDYFRRMQSAAGRMQQLIEDLLAYSRTNATERRFEFIALDAIIDEVKAELKEAIENKKATIEAAEFCPANIIPFQFRQLMHNLINNALKFSRPGIPPHVTIKSEIVTGERSGSDKLIPEKEYCHIIFKDNGIGFEPEYSERIFEVFQRLHGKDEYAGTGIGLAIVKKIVENHNGVITASGELNKGARFDIYIPSN